eukprot:7207167-Karenia_brevis.AAC.1
MSNNCAEYRAAIMGITAAVSLGGIRLLRCRGDSQLVIMQAAGRWRVRQLELVELRHELLAAIGEPHNASQTMAVEWEHIERRFNWRADALANRALDGHAADQSPLWEAWYGEAVSAVAGLAPPTDS